VRSSQISRVSGEWSPFYARWGRQGKLRMPRVPNPGNVSPLDDPVPDALEQADTRRPRQSCEKQQMVSDTHASALPMKRSTAIVHQRALDAT
jgi:hypothetical protein